MANTRADIGPIGELPTFGNSQVPQSADINSYSDRMLAREAGASAETSSRIFEGLSAKLGAAADQAAHFEGTMAGKVAGNDPNYRPDPNASETIRGRAFADAANATYLNNIDAQSKAAASQVYDQYLALPPGQRQPAVLAQGLDRVHNEFLKDHLFPEIAGEFNQRYTNWSTGFLQGAARDLEATTRDQAKASFIQSNNANYDVAMKLASVGDDSVAPQLHAAVQQGLAKIDGSVASGAISAVEGVAQKQQLRNDTWLADMQARRLKLPPDQRPAFDAAVNKQGAPAMPATASPANWSNGIVFGKAGPISYPTSPSDPIGDDVKAGLAAMHQNFGAPITLTSTTNGQHADGSYHYQGKAVDVSIAGMDGPTITKLIDSARAAGFTGFGLGGTHLHIDMRPSNGAAVVFPDHPNPDGLVAGKDIGDWQAHLNSIAAPAKGPSQATGPSFDALQKYNVFAASQDRSDFSQARQAEKEQLATIGDLSKKLDSQLPIDPNEYSAAQRQFAGSPSPDVQRAWAFLDGKKTMFAAFQGMRPEDIEAAIDNMKSKVGQDGSTSPFQAAQIQAAEAYVAKYRKDLGDDMLGRASLEKVVTNVTALNPADPNLHSALVARQAQVAHASEYYRQPSDFFLKGEGASFAQGLANSPTPLAAIADAPTLTAMAADEGFKKGLIANSRSGDPQRMNASFSAMKAIADASPMEAEAVFGKQALASMAAWDNLVGPRSAPEAAKLVMALNDPSQSTARQYKDEAANKDLKSLDGNGVLNLFKQSSFSLSRWTNGQTQPPVSTPDLPQGSLDGLRSDYADAYKTYYVLDGNPDAAKAHALESLSRKWGVSGVNGNRLMPYPPERLYPPVDGGYGYINRQLDADIKAHAGPAYVPELGEGGEEINAPTDAQRAGQHMAGAARALVPDATTKADIEAGRPPSYRVVLQGLDGQFHMLEQSPGTPLRFFADAKGAQAEAEARFNGRRAVNSARDADAAKVNSAGPIGVP